jgi:hypothetical protein
MPLPVVLFCRWLARLLWKPKPTRQVAGLPASVAGRIRPSLEALAPDTPANVAEEIRQEVEDALRECLHERGVAADAYRLVIGADPLITARIVCVADSRSWAIEHFDDFLDFGLHDEGSASDDSDAP